MNYVHVVQYKWVWHCWHVSFGSIKINTLGFSTVLKTLVSYVLFTCLSMFFKKNDIIFYTWIISFDIFINWSAGHTSDDIWCFLEVRLWWLIFVIELQALRGSPVTMRKKSGNQMLRTQKTKGGQELVLWRKKP